MHPYSQDFVSKTPPPPPPLKRTRDPWRVVKFRSCSRRIRIDPVHLVVTRKHKRFQGCVKRTKEPAERSSLMKICQIKHQKGKKKVQKPRRTRWYAKATDTTVAQERGTLSLLGIFTGNSTCLSNSRWAESHQVTVSFMKCCARCFRLGKDYRKVGLSPGSMWKSLGEIFFFLNIRAWELLQTN